MQFANLLKSSAISALAVVMALPALSVAADAQDRPRTRGEQLTNRDSGNRGADRGERRGGDNRSQRSAGTTSYNAPAPMREARREARQIDRQSERQAARIEYRGDQRAERAADNGNFGRAARIDNRSERTADRVERNGDRQAAATVRDARRDTYNRSAGTTSYPDNRGRDWSNRDRRDNYRDYRNDNRSRDYRDDNRNRDYRDGNRNGTYRDGYRDARRDYRRWDNNNWRRDRRYNWNTYRNSNRSLYRLGRYYSPYRNYSYRRLSIGFFLDSLFYSNRYWINDPWQYRLPEVYGPYRWVRYYDDALLVDTYTGEVVDVIHDFFW